MGLFDTLRKGLKFVLMSMGISSPAKKDSSQKTPANPRP